MSGRSIQWILLLVVSTGCGAGPSSVVSDISVDAGHDGGLPDLGPDPISDGGVHADAAAIGDLGGTHDATPSLDVGPSDAGLDREREPVVFIHGIGGSSVEFDVMKARLVADGWAADRLYALDFPDPRWGCNVDNAEVIRMAVARIRAETGAPRVDLVAHSMGTLSSRYYVQSLGGLDEVASYVTLGGLHHGNRSACLNPLPVCVWQELCPTNPYLSALNLEPVDLGVVHWVSICSLSDDTADLATCHFDPVVNVEVDGVDHAGPSGLLEHPDVYPLLKMALEHRVP